jgi:hypothetical protein
MEVRDDLPEWTFSLLDRLASDYDELVPHSSRRRSRLFVRG